MKSFRSAQRQAGVRRVGVTMTPEEYGKVEARAIRFGETPTAHVKRLAFSALENRYLVPPEIAKELAEAVAIMRGIGNNLNQLARHSNEMRAFLDTESVRGRLQHLERALRDFIEKPSREPS